MLLIKENSDPDDGAAGGQDILAMTIIGWLFVHHGLMQTQRSIDGLIGGFSNILGIATLNGKKNRNACRNVYETIIWYDAKQKS